MHVWSFWYVQSIVYTIYMLLVDDNRNLQVAAKLKTARVDLGLAEPGAPTNVACNRYYSFMFDGSTQQGEAIAIIIRFVNDQWEIVQRLVRIDIVAKSVKATKLSQVLMETLFTDMQIRGQQVLQ